MTENYRPVLALSRALVLGFSPEDVFSGMSTPFQTLDFSLPLLFERFAFRILRQAGAELDLDVRYRESDPEAILDGLGQGYRRVEPDIVLFRGGRAVGVVDAKYKPRYVAGLPSKPIPPQDRVSNADIYQLFFYQSRLMNLYRMTEHFEAAIVAPQAPGTRSTSDMVRRTIVWRSNEQTEAAFSLSVLPLPLDAVLDRLRGGASELGALEEAPEVLRFLERCRNDRTR